MLSAGIAGITYSATHQNLSGTTFWKGWSATAALGFAFGFVSGLVTSPVGMIATARVGGGALGRIFANSGQIVLRGAKTSGLAVLQQLGNNGIERELMHDKSVGLADGLGLAAGIGAAAGVLGGLKEAIRPPGSTGTLSIIVSRVYPEVEMYHFNIARPMILGANGTRVAPVAPFAP